MAFSFKAMLKKFRQLQGSPDALARGTAVGVFVGLAPLIPAKTLLMIVLTTLTRSSLVAAMLVCTLICNPLTYIPLYYLAWLVGSLLLPGRIDWAVLQATLTRMQELHMLDALRLAGKVGWDVGQVVLVGGLILALPPALCSYPLARRFFNRIARQRAAKHLLNNPTRKEAG